MTDGLSTLYQDLLGGSYDCVDRIVLNAYFRMGHDPGGCESADHPKIARTAEGGVRSKSLFGSGLAGLGYM